MKLVTKVVQIVKKLKLGAILNYVKSKKNMS